MLYVTTLRQPFLQMHYHTTFYVTALDHTSPSSTSTLYCTLRHCSGSHSFDITMLSVTVLHETYFICESPYCILCHFPGSQFFDKCIILLHAVSLSWVSLPLQIHHHIALFATAMGDTSICTSPFCTLRHWTGSHLFDKYITILHPVPLFWITLLQSHQDILLTTLGHTSMSLVTMVDSTKFATDMGDGSGQYMCDFERNPTILPLPFFKFSS